MTSSPKRIDVTLTVNGEPVAASVAPRTNLADLLREQLGLTGTHIGCETSHCGVCTVDIDGKSVKSCTHLAVQCEGASVTTVEGLASKGVLHAVQEGFYKEHGLQCGFCTPGLIMATHSLLDQNPSPTELEIREGLSGNLCRCTGYGRILDAVQRVAVARRGAGA